MGGSYSTYGGDENTYDNLVGKAEGKTRLERPGRRRDDNIRIDLRKTN